MSQTDLSTYLHAIASDAISDFFVEVEAERHRDLIERGNLKPARKSSQWTGVRQWEAKGYYALVEVCACSHCGSESLRLLGTFHEETSQQGETRSIAVRFPTLNQQGKIPARTQRVEVPSCVSCLPLDFN